MSNNIYLKTFPDNSWELYNKDSLELCSKSYKEYLNVFKEVTEDVDFSKKLNILIVGGGDRQIYKYLITKITVDSTVTIVDPLVGEFDIYEPLYVDLYVKHMFLNFTEYKMLFSEAYPNLESSYDMIVVDCSEDILQETSEIYSSDFIEKLNSLSVKNTEIFFYIPPRINNSRTADLVHKYFKSSYKSGYIEAWNEKAVFLKLSPYYNPKMHTHMHANIVFNKEEGNHLFNDNHTLMHDYFYSIVSKYCEVMNTSSFPFKTGGFSGSFILGESHFNWHSYPENNLLTIDLYHCNFDESLISIFVDIRDNFSLESIEFMNLTQSCFDPLSNKEPEATLFFESKF